MRVFTVLLLAAASALFGRNASSDPLRANTPVVSPADPLAKAADLYLSGDYRESVAMARQAASSDARVSFVIARDYYMLGDYKKACEAFEKAFSVDSVNAGLAHWLGRSYRKRAETATPFSAPKYASKARAYFEQAVALDPNNPQMLNDLFDYYLEAPGFLGGGYEKAQEIAKRIGAQNPAQGQLEEARLAERRKQFDTADEQLRRAIDFAPREVARLLDLARSLAKRGQTAQSDVLFNHAEQLAPNSPKVLFARVRSYIEQKRNTEAQTLLNRYLESNLASDIHSRREAQKLLREASGA